MKSILREVTTSTVLRAVAVLSTLCFTANTCIKKFWVAHLLKQLPYLSYTVQIMTFFPVLSLQRGPQGCLSRPTFGLRPTG